MISIPSMYSSNLAATAPNGREKFSLKGDKFAPVSGLKQALATGYGLEI